MEAIDDLADAPSLGLDSLEDDEDSIEPLNPQVYSCIPKIEGDGEISFHVNVPKENGAGSETKGQDTTHYQEPAAKLQHVYRPDPIIERNQFQGLETQQPIWQSQCIGHKHKVPLSEEKVDHIQGTQEFKDMVKQKVKTRKYGFTEDVEAVMIEFLQENDERLPTADEFHLTWQSMRVKLQEEKEVERREKEAEKREKEAEKREKEAEKRERMRLEKENEVEKREKEAEKRERMRLQSLVEIGQRARMRLEQEFMKLVEEYNTEKGKQISLQNQMENETEKRTRME